MSLPTESDISAALRYMAETDEQGAKLAAHVKALEHQAKTIKGLAFLDATGATMAEKEAEAVSSSAYRAWIEDYENAVADSETIKAKRKRAELTVEVWRSINANQRRGNV